jgi:hypothetical protein
MIHQAPRLARALPSERASGKERVHPDGGFEALRPYLREIGGLETLTVEQEIALARAVDDPAASCGGRSSASPWRRASWSGAGAISGARTAPLRRSVPGRPGWELIHERSDGQLRAGSAPQALLE